MKIFPHYTQLDSMDCGPSCLRMIAKFYGRTYTLQNLREKCFITREDVPLPCILHWNQNHFVVLYKISRSSKLPLPLGGGRGERSSCTAKNFKKSWAAFPPWILRWGVTVLAVVVVILVSWRA